MRLRLCVFPGASPAEFSTGPKHACIGLIQVKEEGWTGFSKGWQGCSEGFSEGKVDGKSRGAALLAQGKTRPCQLFYGDLHSISNRFFHFQKWQQNVQQNFFLQGF